MILKKTLPKEVIDHWPEVFGEINLKVIPIRYLDSILISFKDGRSWSISVRSKLRCNDTSKVEAELQEFFTAYDDAISNIDFKLDTEKVKRDILKITGKFLKKRKL